MEQHRPLSNGRCDAFDRKHWLVLPCNCLRKFCIVYMPVAIHIIALEECLKLLEKGKKTISWIIDMLYAGMRD